MSEAWTQLADRGSSIFAIRDNPVPEGAGVRDVPACLDKHSDDFLACATPRSSALPPDPVSEAMLKTPGATLLDLTECFYTRDVCPAVIGGAVVYRDGHHLAQTYALSLTDKIAAALVEASTPAG
jgi:hypothetical protein